MQNCYFVPLYLQEWREMQDSRLISRSQVSCPDALAIWIKQKRKEQAHSSSLNRQCKLKADITCFSFLLPILFVSETIGKLLGRLTEWEFILSQHFQKFQIHGLRQEYSNREPMVTQPILRETRCYQPMKQGALKERNPPVRKLWPYINLPSHVPSLKRNISTP